MSDLEHTSSSVIPSNTDYAFDPQIWDLIIVGAGVAGSALAHSQGKDGRRVLLLERDLAEPDRIVGEYLQPGGVQKLEELGLGDCVAAIDAAQVQGYCIIKKGERAFLSYPDGGVAGSVTGRGFHHGRFIQKLRQAAAAHPTVTLRQGIVKALTDEEGRAWRGEEGVIGGVIYRTPDGEDRIARGALTVVCDGMHSCLRTHLSVPRMQQPSYFVGLILKGCQLPHKGRAHSVIARPAPVLFYPISSTEVRCMVDVPGPKLPSLMSGELQAYLRDNVAPQLPPSLQAPFLKGVEEGAIRSMQCKVLPAAPLRRPGGLLLGDSFNMRHPITGGGMTVALSDVALLSEILGNLPDFKDPHKTARSIASFYWRRIPYSASINILANSLYDMMCDRGSEGQAEIMDACFNYLKLGQWYSEGPVSLIGGLSPRLSTLAIHMLCMAIFGAVRLQTRWSPLRGWKLIWSALFYAVTVYIPLVKAEALDYVSYCLRYGQRNQNQKNAPSLWHLRDHVHSI